MYMSGQSTCTWMDGYLGQWITMDAEEGLIKSIRNQSLSGKALRPEVGCGMDVGMQPSSPVIIDKTV
jgi:hypothetical protein